METTQLGVFPNTTDNEPVHDSSFRLSWYAATALTFSHIAIHSGSSARFAIRHVKEPLATKAETVRMLRELISLDLLEEGDDPRCNNQYVDSAERYSVTSSGRALADFLANDDGFRRLYEMTSAPPGTPAFISFAREGTPERIPLPTKGPYVVAVASGGISLSQSVPEIGLDL